jgi:cytochrome c
MAIGFATLSLLGATIAAQAAGDAEAGAQLFRNCAACHSLAPGRHMTGPSLAGIWERRAGTVDGFVRYSQALKSAEVVWNAGNLDAWLADPAAFIPGNFMKFPGIKDANARTNLIAYLQTAGSHAAAPEAEGGGMMGGMMSADVPPLKDVDPGQQVTAIRYCGDTYTVTTADGQTMPYWERNLRFKTDSSAAGPPPGRPALMPAGMMGDRASVIFAAPAEISAFIEAKC